MSREADVAREAEATATSVAAVAATTETVELALLASWRLPGADKRRERARGRGGDDDSLFLAFPVPAVGASIMN